jgi:hypothetical protein
MKLHKPEILNLFGCYLFPFIRVEKWSRGQWVIVVGWWSGAIAFKWEGK